MSPSNFNQRGQTVRGDQYNADVIYTANVNPTLLLEKAEALLEAGNSRESEKLLRSVIAEKPDCLIAYFYLARSLLLHKRAKSLTFDEFREIEQCMSNAAGSAEERATILWFWALIRADFYHSNRHLPPRDMSPSLEELLRQAEGYKVDKRKLYDLLSKHPMPRNYLYDSLMRQLT